LFVCLLFEQTITPLLVIDSSSHWKRWAESAD